MPKETPKALINLYAENEINPSCQPRPLGEIVSGGQIGVSYDPEILLANQDKGISGSGKTPQGSYILPPAPDEAAWKYSMSRHVKAMKETLAEYCPTQPYFIGSLIKGVGNIVLYSSKIDNNIGNPLTDTTKWDAYDITRVGNATTSRVGAVQMASGSTTNIVPDNNSVNAALNLKAPLLSPALTGTATAPTAATTDSSNRIATTEFASRPYVLLGTVVREYMPNGTAPAIITEPNGIKKFLINGQTITQAQAPALFAKKGWSVSQVLVDEGGRVELQVGNGYSTGSIGGDETHTLTKNELPNYNLVYNFGTYAGLSNLPGREMSFNKANGNENAFISSGGGNQPHNNMQPYIVVPKYLIGW